LLLSGSRNVTDLEVSLSKLCVEILGNSVRIVEKHYAQWIESRQTALEEAIKKTWA